mmetsp:Transcript_97029/g.274169  ORF Transcript_97029/g.274169 Transcript_97029/m.274169 type:complete len:327 (-) Transcript_97029:571-1551(-)
MPGAVAGPAAPSPPALANVSWTSLETSSKMRSMPPASTRPATSVARSKHPLRTPAKSAAVNSTAVLLYTASFTAANALASPSRASTTASRTRSVYFRNPSACVIGATHWSMPTTGPKLEPSSTLPRFPSLPHASGSLSKLLMSMSRAMRRPRSCQTEAAPLRWSSCRCLCASMPIMLNPSTNSMTLRCRDLMIFMACISSPLDTAALRTCSRKLTCSLGAPPLLSTRTPAVRTPSADANLWAKSSVGEQFFAQMTPAGNLRRRTPPEPPWHQNASKASSHAVPARGALGKARHCACLSSGLGRFSWAAFCESRLGTQTGHWPRRRE